MQHLKSFLRSLAILAAFFSAGDISVFASDRTQYCNAVQSDVGFIRYPLGEIGVWSSEMGEIASVMTRVPRVYPCLDSVVVRPLSTTWRFVEEDWRASITGDPSMLTVKYQANKPSGASTLAMTVSPHVSVFQITFPKGAQKKYIVFDFGKPKVDPWATLNTWKERIVTRIDDRTIQATIGEPGKPGAYYIIRFSVPCTGSGIMDDTTGTITDGANKVAGSEVGMYARFDAPTVTVAIAESFTSMNKAGEHLASEYADFETVRKRCKAAWNKALSRVEIEGSETGKRVAYSALYTIYANIIDANDGSCYLKYYPRARSVSSSAYWQFIGGFHSCCWDNYRTVYPFLMLGYPDVMSDVVNNYYARYQREGCMTGNICLFTGATENRLNMRPVPVLMAQAYGIGIQADYSKIYAALKDNYDNPKYLSANFSELGYLTQPATGGKACSETMEYSTGMHSLGLLAKANNDEEGFKKYMRLSKNYKNVWDSTSKAFRVRNADGTWGPLDYKNWTWNPNPQGLFEGTTLDWMFAIPHDPYGLIHLPGQERFVDRVVDYCLNETWFNDYQYIYPYLLYYDGAANAAQKIVRQSWLPMFKNGVMYEETSPKRQDWMSHKAHYTSTAGWVICSTLGLYPMNSPDGQYIISSPSITKAVIRRGGKDITVQAKHNSDENIYIRSIKVDGKVYPSYMIPAQRLASGAKIELEMSSDSTRGLGNLYLSSSDGFVRSAELVSASHLKCVIESAGTDATTQIYSRTKPVKVLVNGREDHSWIYNSVKKTVTLQTTDSAAIEVLS